MAIEELELQGTLIEGYDESKLKKEVYYDEDWRSIIAARQNDKILQAEIKGIEKLKNKYCALVEVGNIRGYIPIDFSGASNLRQLRALAGKKAVFKVMEYMEEDGKRLFVGSRVAALEQMKAYTLRKVKEGDVIIAVVQAVFPKMAYADIGGVNVTLDRKTLKYGWVEDMTDHVKVGDHLQVKVMAVDLEKEEVTVSAKAVQENPWNRVMERYKKGLEYVGTVSGVQDYGVFINLEEGVDALASHLKFEALEKGDKVLVRLIALDKEEEQIRARIIRTYR